MNREILIFPNIEELNNAAAQNFVEIGAEAIEKRGQFVVALAGGSTPKLLYQLLSSDKFNDKIDWKSVFFFFGDERKVPPDSEESNFRMANENLLKPLQISEENVFRWQTELKDAEVIAEKYEETITRFFDLKQNPPANAGGSDKTLPRFDLILLGMGADGHTASLFPFTDAVRTASVSGRVKIADANTIEKLQTTRLTFTFPVINNAGNIIFLVSGEEKAETLKEVLEGEFQPLKFPSQNVKPDDGNLFWLVDKQAAKFLRMINI
jgi:6-phosphogluconolactonase